MQQRVAGLMPRPALDRLYGSGEVDATEYVTLLVAQGQPEEHAIMMLGKAHAFERNNAAPLPEHQVIEPDLPDYNGPKRTAKRVSKRGPELRGHPLD